MIAAIGDVHGCQQELTQLIDKLIYKYGDDLHTIVMLGDYVDRGPNSKGVLDILMNWNIKNIKLVCLMGNHDYMMIQSVLHQDKEMMDLWLTNDSGGTITVMTMGEKLKEYSQWMEENLVTSYHVGNLFFVHAGIDPDYDLSNQISDDLMWIREPFLSSEENFGARIIHGHSPAPEGCDILFNRINLDTGCVFGGDLSAAIFGDDDRLIAIESVKL